MFYKLLLGSSTTPKAITMQSQPPKPPAVNVPQPEQPVMGTTTPTTTRTITQTPVTSSRNLVNEEPRIENQIPGSSDSATPRLDDSNSMGDQNNSPITMPPTDTPNQREDVQTSTQADNGNEFVKDCKHVITDLSSYHE